MKSIVKQQGSVTFPPFIGERVYMQEFRKASGLPNGLSRWQQTINSMLDGVETDGPIYMMVDQSHVKAKTSHRRPGVHIDGNWHPKLFLHGHPGHGGHRIDQLKPEAIILASNVSASAAYFGEFYVDPGEGGDCKHIDVSKMRRIPLLANSVYAGNVGMLHESLPVEVDCFRTLVRLNVPGWEP